MQGFTKGVPIDPDGSLSNNSDLLVPSQKAVKTYVTTLAAGIVAIQANLTNDNALNATVYPVWAAGSSGSQQLFAASTKLSFNPSSGLLFVTALALNTPAAQSRLSILQPPTDTIGPPWALGLTYQAGLDHWGFRLSAIPTTNLCLDRYSGGSTYNVMTFERAGGNVGIGTTTPNPGAAYGAGNQVTTLQGASSFAALQLSMGAADGAVYVGTLDYVAPTTGRVAPVFMQPSTKR